MGLNNFPSFLHEVVYCFIYLFSKQSYLGFLLQVDAIRPAMGRLGQPPGVEALSNWRLRMILAKVL